MYNNLQENFRNEFNLMVITQNKRLWPFASNKESVNLNEKKKEM